MFKNLNNLEEHEFILGIDIGDSTSSIAFFDSKKNSPQVLDISGGYGKSTMSTAFQFINETGDWIFGEYALLNHNDNNPSVSYPITNALKGGLTNLSVFVEQFINHIISTHPKAIPIAIVVAVPYNIQKEDELKSAFNKFKDIIMFVPYSQAVFAYKYFKKSPINETVLLLDYGARAFRASLFKIDKTIKQLSYYENVSLGINSLNSTLIDYFTNIYKVHFNKTEKELTSNETLNLRNFIYQNKDQIFIKQNKALKLYMNFCLPPLLCTLSEIDQKNIISPYKKELTNTLNSVLSSWEVDASDIETVLLTGGGFEMAWVKDLIENIFPDSNIDKYKNPKAVASLGACIIGAQKLKLVSESIVLEYIKPLGYDIGLYATIGKEKVFVPIIKKEAYPGYKHTCNIIVSQNTNNPFTIDLLKKTTDGELSLISVFDIDPIQRPPLTTVLSVSLTLTSDNLIAYIEDKGFGQLFPKTNFNRQYKINLPKE